MTATLLKNAINWSSIKWNSFPLYLLSRRCAKKKCGFQISALRNLRMTLPCCTDLLTFIKACTKNSTLGLCLSTFLGAAPVLDVMKRFLELVWMCSLNICPTSFTDAVSRECLVTSLTATLYAFCVLTSFIQKVGRCVDGTFPLNFH